MLLFHLQKSYTVKLASIAAWLQRCSYVLFIVLFAATIAHPAYLRYAAQMHANMYTMNHKTRHFIFDYNFG